MLIGYMRVSTSEQNLDLQRDGLERAGCEKIFDDVCSGRATERGSVVISTLIHAKGILQVTGNT